MPKAVADKIIALQRKFIWCKEDNPKESWGLGVGDAVLRNTALLFKWWWQFSKEECPLWKKIVCSCNKLNPDIMLTTQSLPVKGGPWKDICQLNIKEPRVRDKVVSGLAMEVGNEWIWNFQWRRELFQWELELLRHLHEMLRPVKLSARHEDNVMWKFDNKGVFSTNSVIQVIQLEMLSDEITSYSFTSPLWKGFVPLRIELFGWFVLVGRVDTKERLTKLGVNIQSDSICVLCTKEIESAEHLFLWCETTRAKDVDDSVLCSDLEHLVGT
ncbi:uncharacterized protein LOC130975187 [Arachis stenosperma]|uniref:uncharacterized protein LOC130975187 n=1 Tax=Arachis stenosperma TaxID=217475 RepID=UPI0025AD3BF0|nr:uncharacterized protein LOC130975187 [Arachis stenosperma]